MKEDQGSPGQVRALQDKRGHVQLVFALCLYALEVHFSRRLGGDCRGGLRKGWQDLELQPGCIGVCTLHVTQVKPKMDKC